VGVWGESDAWAHGLEQGVVFSPDGKLVLSGSSDVLKLWDSTTGKALWSHDSWWVVSIVYSPDGNSVFTGHLNGAVRLWDVKSGKLVRTLHEGKKSGAFPLAFAPDWTLALMKDFSTRGGVFG
jgi:WD40 repeat protein